MQWRAKNLAFQVIDRIPSGRSVHSFLQKKVTGRFHVKLNERNLKTYQLPVEEFRKIPGARTAMEFGAGRSLLTPLLLSHAGAEAVYAFDLYRVATIEQVNAAIQQLRHLLPGDWPQVADFAELETLYGIHYRAPGDARSTGLPDGSVDLIYSTATMEHIPAPDIKRILAEGRRILAPQGRMFFTIDYHDHYASSDPAIGYMNFYQFSREEWQRYNPPSHYQNRLRHSEFCTLFKDCGLSPIEARPIFDTWSETDLQRVRLHPDFQQFSHEDLTASNGLFVLGKEAPAAPPIT